MTITCTTYIRLLLAVVTATQLLSSPATAVTIDWVTVGNPGNTADNTGYGSVSTTYRISKFEVTNAQYAEFLNATAASDPNGLYNTRMADTGLFSSGGITRSGGAGSFTYSAIQGRGNKPVNWVSFYDALRFGNWMNNGQPSGAQDSSTTEDGAYTFSGSQVVGARNGGATIFLTSEDEWYKAAYYDAVSASYFEYPTSSNSASICGAPGPTPNTANCFPSVPQDVGGYTGSASPMGTFDQAGNIMEWNEDLKSGSDRVFRGGSFFSATSELAASTRLGQNPLNERDVVGFRIASTIPEPGTGILLSLGLILLGAARKRQRDGQSAQEFR